MRPLTFFRASTSVAAPAFAMHGWLAVAALLAMVFVTGGAADAAGGATALTQLLSLPLLLWATTALRAAPATGLRRAALLGATLVIAIVAVQQLPIPAVVWNLIPARAALSADLRVAGVTAPAMHWSTAPQASEQALWSLLPALACFLAALALPLRSARRLLVVVVSLCMSSLLLGWLQLAAEQDSWLNPWPQWPLAFNGLFSNPNHQGTAAAIAVISIAAWLFGGWSRLRRAQRWAATIAAVWMYASIPLTGSRAAFLLATAGVAAAWWLSLPPSRGPARYPWRHGRGGLAVVVSSLVVIVFLALWLRFQGADTVRWSLIRTTLRMGWAQFPLGAGSGTFPAWFDQAAGPLLQWEYFNHAHDEYVQWWFEYGVAGVAAMLGVAVILAMARPVRGSTQDNGGVAVAAWLGCLVLLGHSLVDYPLRTPALMSVAGLLAGIAIAHRVGTRSSEPEPDAGINLTTSNPTTSPRRDAARTPAGNRDD